MKPFLVSALEVACRAVDRLPIIRNHYSCQLAKWSLDLNDRWGTEVWHHPTRQSEELT